MTSFYAVSAVCRATILAINDETEKNVSGSDSWVWLDLVDPGPGLHACNQI